MGIIIDFKKERAKRLGDDSMQQELPAIFDALLNGGQVEGLTHLGTVYSTEDGPVIEHNGNYEEEVIVDASELILELLYEIGNLLKKEHNHE